MPIKQVKTAIGKNLMIALNQLDQKQVKVGWFESAKYENGTSVAEVAQIQEYGVPEKNIVPRPFMRPTIIKEQKNWFKLSSNGAKAILNQKATINNVLEGLGGKVAGDIRYTISKLTEPALKESTIKARLAKRKDKVTLGLLDKPLVDTGLLLNSLTHIVEQANE